MFVYYFYHQKALFIGISYISFIFKNYKSGSLFICPEENIKTYYSPSETILKGQKQKAKEKMEKNSRGIWNYRHTEAIVGDQKKTI